MSGKSTLADNLKNHIAILQIDQRGAAASIEKIAAVAVAVLILAAVLKMAINRGGALDQTGLNLASLIDGKPVTGGGAGANASDTPSGGKDTWVPPGIAGASGAGQATPRTTPVSHPVPTATPGAIPAPVTPGGSNCRTQITTEKGIPVYFDPTLPVDGQAVTGDGKAIIRIGSQAEVPAGSKDAIAGPNGKYYNPCEVVHEAAHLHQDFEDDGLYNGSPLSGQSEINATSEAYRCAIEKGYRGYARGQRNKNIVLEFKRWIGYNIDEIYQKGVGNDNLPPICSE